jgi:hypothetical protein
MKNLDIKKVASIAFCHEKKLVDPDLLPLSRNDFMWKDFSILPLE